MRYINYASLYLEVVSKLVEKKHIVLATSSHHKITAKTVSLVTAGTQIMFQTDQNSEAAKIIKQNPSVAFAMDDIQIEATAKFSGHPLDRENSDFLKSYKSKFPDYFKIYSHLNEQVVVKCDAKIISIHKYVNGISCKEVLDLDTKIAYRLS